MGNGDTFVVITIDNFSWIELFSSTGNLTGFTTTIILAKFEQQSSYRVVSHFLNEEKCTECDHDPELIHLSLIIKHFDSNEMSPEPDEGLENFPLHPKGEKPN